MTPRNRILAALKGEKVDPILWIPLCYRDFFLSLPEYRKKFPLKWQEEFIFQDWRIGKSALEDLWKEELKFRIDFYRKIGADFMNWGPFDCIKTEMINVKVKREQKGNNLLIQYETPLGSLKENFMFSIPSQTLFRKDFLIKKKEDYKVFKYILEDTILNTDLSKANAFLEIIGENGVNFADGIAPPLHSWLNDLLGIEKLVFAIFDQKEELIEILEIQEEKKLEKCRILSHLPIKVFLHQATWDVGTISPELYKKYYLPYVKRYNQILHQKGKICLDHLSGQMLKPYLKLIEETDLNGLYGLVYPSPSNDITLEKLTKRWRGKKIIPMGGLDPDFLATASTFKIAEMTKRILEEIEGNPFILGTADAVVYGTQVKNLEMVSETIRKYHG